MRRLGVVLALLALAAPSSAEAAPAASIPTGGALAALADYRFSLLGLEADPAAERLVADRGGTLVSPELHIWRLPSTAAQRLIPRLRDSGALRYAEPDGPVFRQGHLTGGDPLVVPTIGWHLYRVGADRVEPPGPGIPITVVDSGLDIAHMEFGARPNTVLLNQQNVVLNSDEYHGTIVASTAAAPTDAKGTVGIYPQSVLRTYDLDFLTESSIVQGISRAVAAGRSVINLSLGGSEPSRSIYEATINAFGRGSLLVAAAGNERLLDNPPIFPAGFPHVLTVGSINQADQPSDFSSTSAALDLVAPGEQIPWQHPSDPTVFSTANGTSFAAPMVSAATAWVWTVRNTLDKTQIYDLMRLSARNLGSSGPDKRTGLGLLDIPAALTKAAPQIDPLEPNDDIDHVKAHGIFRTAARPVTAPGRRRATYRARLHSTEDPHDVYRVWIPARREVTMTVRPNANVNATVWAPDTKNVSEKGAVRRRHVVASGIRRGGRPEILRIENETRRGYYLYLDVFPGKDVRSATYSLGIRARALPSRPSTRR
jgi:subtilisin family serine protease